MTDSLVRLGEQFLEGTPRAEDRLVAASKHATDDAVEELSAAMRI